MYQRHALEPVLRDRSGLNIGFMDVGGWDSYIGQEVAQGLLVTRLVVLVALGRGSLL